MSGDPARFVHEIATVNIRSAIIGIVATVILGVLIVLLS